MIQRPALSVGKRDAVCVGGVAVLTDDVEYALDKSPYLHGKSADAACAYGQKQLEQTALVEAEVEVVYAEGAEEYSQHWPAAILDFLLAAGGVGCAGC